MNVIKQVMFDEWRFWQRTKLATLVLIIGAVLTLASVVVNTMTMQAKAHDREHLQEASEARFIEQPDRHPHRMVHYGHYVFRTPSPLSILEPGVDAYTGTAIFLEGHRQNSAMFADQRQSSGMTRFSSLSPAFMLQLILPLLIVLIGYATLTREKEAGTLNIMLTQGVDKSQLIFGKFLALAAGGMVLLLPFVVASVFAWVAGESLLVTVSFIMGYLLYILLWCAIVVCVSASSKRGSASFAALIAIWVVLCMLVPRIGSSAAAAIVPSPGKLEADFAVLDELRKLGDGHNANDPAFEKLKQNMLAQYDVESVEELPINFRGVVAQYSEKKLTDVLNQFAEQRMDDELAQAEIARLFGWLSPTVALRTYSMMVSGTNLETHHRFLREAEILRFDFVQALNRLHQDELDYQTDKDRYKDAANAKAARVDASHWQVLSDFDFVPQAGSVRIQEGLLYLAQLVFWLVLLVILIQQASRRMD